MQFPGSRGVPLCGYEESQCKSPFGTPPKGNGYVLGPHPLLAWTSASLPVLQ